MPESVQECAFLVVTVAVVLDVMGETAGLSHDANTSIAEPKPSIWCLS